MDGVREPILTGMKVGCGLDVKAPRPRDTRRLPHIRKDSCTSRDTRRLHADGVATAFPRPVIKGDAVGRHFRLMVQLVVRALVASVVMFLCFFVSCLVCVENDGERDEIK